ncbi:uncharacterized protein AMSG_09809 [Thecamonas trahens ATCC 50062]|uniref:Chromatin associated protein KTI12 n=1 Tax=Thecamonas trahens ATCC 50062 TaxID=461836 RepID=A0A0L0DQZ6_THETB|nr:hypothetical protein AMSG_09809 [Thecamonas trahens ATCC 50062]KNC53858.1 hypothetical protein AMSG_09809 [Thecamonas trahens ATCC 50062]|eukprot:XP_013754238.1 hypothetical protein AMSG_09809 [Thecamonas trahens ATCC 50062]
MPLITMCGRPVTGKSRRAAEMAAYLAEAVPDVRVVTVSAESLGLDKAACYAEPSAEKTLRAEFKAAVEREIGPGVVVICDSLNYIKGFRYELYCDAKAQRTPSCVVWCDTADELAEGWNDDAGLAGAPRYSHELFDDLWMRFEEPNGRKRWDKPLFVVGPDDELPAAAITAWLLESKPVKPNESTQSAPRAASSFVTALDGLTRSVVDAVLAWAAAGGLPGDPILLDGGVRIILKRKVTPAEIRRARKQYLKLAGMTPPPADAIIASFADFLASTING